jgi:MATE family multidrug resistance protein
VRRVLDAQGLWLVLLPLVAAPSYLLDGLFIGAGRTRAMMLGMLVSVVAVYLPAWYLSRPLGNHGLWLAFTLFNAARGLTLAIAWVWLSRRGRWLDQPG